MSGKKPWTPGRVIWWLMVGGLLGIIFSGFIENGDVFVISMMSVAIGLVLFSIRLLFK